MRRSLIVLAILVLPALSRAQIPREASLAKPQGCTTRPRFVMVNGNRSDMIMSGDEEDLRHARALHEKIQGDFVWFKLDEKYYILTDPTFLERIRTLLGLEIQRSQTKSDAGTRFDKSGPGQKREGLGRESEKSKVTARNIAPDLERIRAQLKDLEAKGATQSDLAKLQLEMAEVLNRTRRLQSRANREQTKASPSLYERSEGDLSRQQDELGLQAAKRALRQAEAARESSRELCGIFDDAIAKGIAKQQ